MEREKSYESASCGFTRFLPSSLSWHCSFRPLARAQDDSEQSKGINSGDYNIHQTIEFGYRSSNINGNLNTYNTFENLGSGLRLFDFDVQMHSLDHNGLLFDNLTFSNFGYGGDPNDVYAPAHRKE